MTNYRAGEQGGYTLNRDLAYTVIRLLAVFYAIPVFEIFMISLSAPIFDYLNNDQVRPSDFIGITQFVVQSGLYIIIPIVLWFGARRLVDVVACDRDVDGSVKDFNYEQTLALVIMVGGLITVIGNLPGFVRVYIWPLIIGIGDMQTRDLSHDGMQSFAVISILGFVLGLAVIFLARPVSRFLVRASGMEAQDRNS